MKKLILAAFLLLTLALSESCKERFAEPTYAVKGRTARIWYKDVQFYTPDAEIYIDSINSWRRVTAFPLVYDNDPDKYGFGNPYVPGKGSNALYMNTIYGRLPGGTTSDSGYYNITIPKAFQFVPDGPNATKGKVLVLPQKVKIYRRDKTFYNIGISGEGTYDETTETFEVEVIFDETEVGGPAAVKRRYRFKP